MEVFMKNRNIFYLLCLTLFLFLPGCDIVVGIFEAGFWTAIILVALILAAIVYGYSKFKGSD